MLPRADKIERALHVDLLRKEKLIEVDRTITRYRCEVVFRKSGDIAKLHSELHTDLDLAED